MMYWLSLIALYLKQAQTCLKKVMQWLISILVKKNHNVEIRSRHRIFTFSEQTTFDTLKTLLQSKLPACHLPHTTIKHCHDKDTTTYNICY